MGVVILPKNFQQIVEADNLGVEDHFHGFGMAGAIRADLFVGGLCQGSANVADLRGFHTRKPAKRRLDAPEASGGEGSGFESRGIRRYAHGIGLHASIVAVKLNLKR